MIGSRPTGWAIAALALVPASGYGHAGAGQHPGPLWGAWQFDPTAIALLLLAAWIYARGLRRVWSRAGVGRGIPRSRALAYASGLLALVAALLSPLEAAASALFSAHMVQHLLLILVAPPLIVLGAPDLALIWALPPRWRPAAARLEQAVGGRLSGGGRGPIVAVLLATGMLWVWHVPRLYDLALRNEAVHWAEHAGFLLTALLFWATVLRLRPRDRVDNGARILYVSAMAFQGSILGALITFAPRPLYASHARISPDWGLGPLADQQVAGLIMWVPPALLYFAVVAYLFTSWLSAVGARREAQDRRERRDAAAARAGPGADSGAPAEGG